MKSGNVVNFISKLCMDPVGETPTVNGTRIQVTKCDAIADKFWEWTKDGFLRNPTSGKCLDVVGRIPGTANGSALQLWDCEYDKSTTDQRWWFTPDRQLLNLHTGKCIDIPGAENYSDGALLQVWDCENGTTLTDQLWELLPAVTASNPYSGIVLPEWTRLGKCTDADRDCISDALEDTIAATFMPVFVFDEEEHNILANQNFSDFGPGNGVEYLYQVSIADCYTKVDSNSNPTSAVFQLGSSSPLDPTLNIRTPRSIMFTVLEIFPYDYLPKQNILYDFSDEEDVFVHYGDVETIKFCLRDDDRNGAYTVSFIQFRRHKKEYIINATWEKEGTHMVFVCVRR